MKSLGYNTEPNRRQHIDGTVVDSWFGLRYASTPHRFARPEPDRGRIEVQRLAEVPVFPQAKSRLSSVMGEGHPNPQSEDAYFLNIWSPREAKGLPVLFFIHGGAWTSGGGSNEWYDGARLAARGAVVITTNYRLGPLGHLGPLEKLRLPLPVEDLLLALRWVKSHVNQFGGDPEAMTVVGQSAGGWYSHLLSLLPETRGWFHQVAHLSMGIRPPWPQNKQQAITQLASAKIAPDHINQAPVEHLLTAGQGALLENAPPPSLSYAPSAYLPVNTPELPEDLFDPHKAAQKTHVSRVFLRWTTQETATFFHNSRAHLEVDQSAVDHELSSWPVHQLPKELVAEGEYRGADSGLSPYQQLVAASSWVQFQQFPSEYSCELKAVGVSVQESVFTRESLQPYVYAGHCADLPYQFGTWDSWSDAPMLEGVSRDAFEDEAAVLMDQLISFVKGSGSGTRNR